MKIQIRDLPPFDAARVGAVEICMELLEHVNAAYVDERRNAKGDIERYKMLDRNVRILTRDSLDVVTGTTSMAQLQAIESRAMQVLRGLEEGKPLPDKYNFF